MRWGLQDIFVFIMRRNSSQFYLYGCNYIIIYAFAFGVYFVPFVRSFGLKFRINVYMSDRIKNYLLPRDGCEDLKRWWIRIYPFFRSFFSIILLTYIYVSRTYIEQIQNYTNLRKGEGAHSLLVRFLCLFYIEFMVYTYYETFNLYYIIRNYTFETFHFDFDFFLIYFSYYFFLISRVINRNMDN